MHRERMIYTLVLFSIILLVIDSVFSLSGKGRTIVYFLDGVICIILGIDYVERLLKSDTKRLFLKNTWYEVLAIIPAYTFMAFQAQFIGGALRILRFVRVVRSIKIGILLSRSFKLIIHAKNIVIRSKILYVASLSILATILSSTVIYTLEGNLEGSNIKDFFDAIWWSLTTLTTVGYGDIVPITREGKILGIFLMVFGVIVWSSTISLLSASIIKEEVKDENLTDELKRVVEKYSKKVGKLSKKEAEMLNWLIRMLNEMS